jgi:hypothetical protein
MAAGQFALEPRALCDGEDRLVVHGLGGNAEVAEACEKILAGGWQA